MKQEEARALAREYVWDRQAEHEHKCGFANGALCGDCSSLMQGYVDGLMRGSRGISPDELDDISKGLSKINADLSAILKR